MKMKRQSPNFPRGMSIVQVLMIGVVVLGVASAMTALVITMLNFAGRTQKSISATFIAEAGINYYLWHLSHNVTDYCDDKPCGTLGADGYGPFAYDYKSPDGRVLGSYKIYVKPPTAASASVTVRSVGQSATGGAKRTVQASISIPSFAQYALLTNTEIWIGPNESVDGPLHSNVGVHFDGTGNSTISAAQSSYIPASAFGGNGVTPHTGVWGTGGPSSLFQYPVPPIDFQSVTADLQKLKATAQATNGYLAPTNPGAPATKLGYYLELRSDGRIDVYRLTREQCSSTNRTFIQTLNHPSSDILYVEDNVWIRNVPGQTFPSRLTIAASYLPSNASTDKSITIMGDIKYTAKDGTAAIGLIGQKDVKVSRQAPNNLEIDAAMLAQTGHVWYQKDTLGGTNCSQTVKGTITVYGSIATDEYWTWTYVTGSPGNYNTVDGYNTTSSTYDAKLRLTPPPSFPLTGTFSILNYREILNEP